MSERSMRVVQVSILRPKSRCGNLRFAYMIALALKRRVWSFRTRLVPTSRS